MKLLRLSALVLSLSFGSLGFSQTTLASWDASGAPNAAWGIGGDGGAWMSMVEFTASVTGVVGNAGVYLYQSSSSAYSITYQLWSSQPTEINLAPTGQPGFLGSATVSGAGISTTNGELVVADFTSQNFSMTSGSTYYLLPILGSGSANWNESGASNASPATFYNTNGTGSLTSASWTSNQGSKDVGFSVTTAIPEPSTYAALAGLMALGTTVIVRRRQRPAITPAA